MADSVSTPYGAALLRLNPAFDAVQVRDIGREQRVKPMDSLGPTQSTKAAARLILQLPSACYLGIVANLNYSCRQNKPRLLASLYQ
jgi:hypothetical protein